MPEDKTPEKKEEAYKAHVYQYPQTEEAKSDKPIIVFGLLVFVVLMLGATVANRAIGKFTTKPVLELPKHEKQCIRDTRYMRENHMKLLNDWRDQVVRDGVRTEKIPKRDAKGKIIKVGGKTVYKTIERSLTKNCLSCHDNPKAFCDRCHIYTGVTKPGGTLSCFHCHIQPNPKKVARR